MIRFGPAGNSDAFYEEGHKHTVEAMEWVARMGLNAYEVSFGRGVRLKEETAGKIGEEARRYGVALSVHAPYFINLATDDPEKIAKNTSYFLESARAARWLGADRVVFHPGSCAKMDRNLAFNMTIRNFSAIMSNMDEQGFGDLTFCPETMGKINQLGDLFEIIQLANVDERVLPTIDFGHLHTRGRGAIQTQEDFRKILDALEDGIGHERTARMHVHFSKIEYTAMGEKQHRTFAEEGYGPHFEQLAPLLWEKRLEPRIICESKGTMAMDALTMKRMFEQAKAGRQQ